MDWKERLSELCGGISYMGQDNGSHKVKSKVQVFDTPQVVNCFKVESDAAMRG